LVDEIRIGDVKVPEGRFRTSTGDIRPLMESIKKVGLLHPIGITEDNVLVYGFRRLQAAKALGWEKISFVRVTLDGALKRLAELEENTRRKDWRWQEEVKAKLEVHRLCQTLHGTPKSGYRADLLGPLTDTEKGWGLKETAKFLGESIGLVSQDMKLAFALDEHPELWKETNKSNAMHKLERIENPENFPEKSWECGICGTGFVGSRDRCKLTICPVCYAQVAFSRERLKADAEGASIEKPMSLREWLGMDDDIPEKPRVSREKMATRVTVA